MHPSRLVRANNAADQTVLAFALAPWFASLGVPQNWIAAALLLALASSATGCRSRAKQDVYVQRLSGEVRLLEDQLYEADYRNRILADKLERQRAKAEEHRPEKSPRPNPTPPITLHSSPRSQTFGDGGRLMPGPIEQGEIIPPPIITPDPLADPPIESKVPRASDPSSNDPTGADGMSDFDLENSIDTGQPIAPEELSVGDPAPETGSGPDDNKSNDTESSNRGDPFVDDGSPFQPPSERSPETGDSRYEMPSFGLPPGEPEPPGKDDLTIPPIIEGEIIPPPPGDLETEEIPGKVPGLPNTLRDLGKGTSTAPERLSLHPGFSGAQQYYANDEADGLMLVINVLDEDGRMMDLNSFDVEAELSIVALNPSKPGDEARVARWDFGPDEVKKLIRHVPVSGFHVPVIWETTPPDVDEVIVHVRLQSGDDKMSCEGRVNVARNARVARWSPRAASSSSGKRAQDRPSPARPTRQL